MSRNSSGTYTLPLPPVVTGEVIEAAWANTSLDDLAQAMTDSLDRFGRGGMLAPFKLVDGTIAAPAFAFNTEPGMGLYRSAPGVMGIAIGGESIGVWSANGLAILTGNEVFCATPPSGDNALANKKYVDDAITGGGFNGGTIENGIQFDASAWANGTITNHIINGNAAESYWGVLRTQGTKNQGMLFGAASTELRQSNAAGDAEFALSLADTGNLNFTGKRFFPSVIDFPAFYLGDDGANSPILQFNPGSFIVSFPGNGNMTFRTPGLYDFDKQIEVNKEGSIISGFYQLRAVDGLNRVWMQCQDGTGDFVIWNNGFSAPLLRLTQAGVLSILGNVVSLS
jgi:hypothetical protein